MICPECKGERAVYRCFQNRITLTPCPKCNGVGEVVHTNFDRITASPEALAEFIHEAESVYERCAKGDLNCDYCECQWCGLAGKKEIADWLKEESES